MVALEKRQLVKGFLGEFGGRERDSLDRSNSPINERKIKSTHEHLLTHSPPKRGLKENNKKKGGINPVSREAQGWSLSCGP